MKYERVIKAVRETPWAIRPRVLEEIRALLTLRANGEHLSEDEIRERIGAGPSSRPLQRIGAVAVLPLYGVIFPKANLFTDMSGGTPVSRFRDWFRQALGNKEVGSILLDIDSPGGMVDQIPELATEIRKARGDKQIVAIANTDAASAAYWLGSQADRFVVTPSGKVGSIGVFAAHEDISGAEEKAGVKTTLISAGKFKIEGNPFEPLSEEAEEAIQATVDEFYGMFLSDVAKGRRTGIERVRSGFGEGRMVTAKNALAEGMVDEVATFDSVLGRLAGRSARGPRPLDEARAALESGEPISFDEWRALQGLEGLPDDDDDDSRVIGEVVVEITADTTKLEQALARVSTLHEDDHDGVEAAQEEEPHHELLDVEVKDSGAPGKFTLAGRLAENVVMDGPATLTMSGSDIASTEDKTFALEEQDEGTRFWARLSNEHRTRVEGQTLAVSITQQPDGLRVVLENGRSPQGGAEPSSQQGGGPADEAGLIRAELAEKAARLQLDLSSLKRRADQL